VDLDPTQLFDRWTLDQLAEALREGVPGAARVSDALDSARSGDLPTAGREIAAALDTSEDLRLLFLGFQFFFRTNDHPRAEALTLQRLRIAERDGETIHVARACTNLGLIHLTTGRHESALPLMRRAVDIDERLGNEEGLARDLGNLANVHEEAGELEEATRLNLRALEIAERIGAAEVAAGRHANLGDIAMSQGRPDEARARWTHARSEFAHLGIEKWRKLVEDKLRTLDADPE
jgi:tetratricopeptide (TPR) repeat protein